MEGLLGIGSKEPVSSGLRTRDIDYTQGDPDMMVRQEAEGRRSLAYEHRDFFELLREYPVQHGHGVGDEKVRAEERELETFNKWMGNLAYGTAIRGAGALRGLSSIAHWMTGDPKGFEHQKQKLWDRYRNGEVSQIEYNSQLRLVDFLQATSELDGEKRRLFVEIRGWNAPREAPASITEIVKRKIVEPAIGGGEPLTEKGRRELLPGLGEEPPGWYREKVAEVAAKEQELQKWGVELIGPQFNDPEFRKAFMSLPFEQEFTRSGLIEGAEYLSNIARRHPEWAAEQKDTWYELISDPEALIGNILQSAPPTIFMMATSAAGVPELGILAMYAVENDGYYQAAIAQGLSPEEAAKGARLYAGASTAIEYFQMKGFMGFFKGAKLPGAAAAAMNPFWQTAGAEALEEALQGTVQDVMLAVQTGQPMDPGKFIDDRLREMTIAAGMTGGMKGAATVVQGRLQIGLTIDPEMSFHDALKQHAAEQAAQPPAVAPGQPEQAAAEVATGTGQEAAAAGGPIRRTAKEVVDTLKIMRRALRGQGTAAAAGYKLGKQEGVAQEQAKGKILTEEDALFLRIQQLARGVSMGRMDFRIVKQAADSQFVQEVVAALPGWRGRQSILAALKNINPDNVKSITKAGDALDKLISFADQREAVREYKQARRVATKNLGEMAPEFAARVEALTDEVTISKPKESLTPMMEEILDQAERLSFGLGDTMLTAMPLKLIERALNHFERLGQKPLTEMPADAIRDMTKAFKAVVHLHRTKGRLLTLLGNQTVDGVVDEAAKFLTGEPLPGGEVFGERGKTPPPGTRTAFADDELAATLGNPATDWMRRIRHFWAAPRETWNWLTG
ncbi:MAG TPA: hypothetical protein VM223_06805, partial [Planctomycetota bacterium]|nr:hypothetical protein [Planctomycetota bacterium]